MKIASAQIPNTTNIENNFKNILSALEKAVNESCDLLLFPECSLSGFTAEMKKCTMEFLGPYLKRVNEISFQNNLTVVLPSAYVEENKIYNAVFIFDSNQMCIQYKIGLTESEKNFFSVPEDNHTKVFALKGLRIAVLVCIEAQMSPFSFFNNGDVDLILWPGYIHSGAEKNWSDNQENKVFQNMASWKVPLIQSNFSFNDLPNHQGNGPDGHSIILDKNNKLIGRGEYKENDFLIASIGHI
ncbi:MAG: carbon-nitrogen hydrolase family protein [Bacteriovorax sp.]